MRCGFAVIGLCWMMAVARGEVPAGMLEMRLTGAPALSPDGKQVVFEWLDDLWLAPVVGGEARRVVEDAGRDAYPRITPDGRRLVFSSDRSGSMEVYSQPLQGGEVVRHTWHSEGNELECLSPDGRRAVVRGMREVAGFRATRLMEVDLTNERRERRLFDATAHSAAWSPDGGRVLFCRGGEQLYRKGYRGSRASAIWHFDRATRGFRFEAGGDFEARSPLWLPDGSGFYFVSSEGGTANLWVKDGGGLRQLTFYQDDGVVTPDLSADGTVLVFRRGLEVHVWRPAAGGEAVVARFWTRERVPDTSRDVRRIRGCGAADFTPDGNQVVFAAAGDLWWISKPGEKARQLTEGSGSEDDPRFSPDGRWLYYRVDDGLACHYWRARFEGGQLADPSAVTDGLRAKCRLRPSPDGRMIAWIEGNGDVFTAAADGSGARRVFPCWDRPTLEWSPDGKWLALAAEDRDANRDIYLIRADGGRPPLNLTRHPGFEGSPKWSPDGRWLVFSGRRDASGKTSLWRIDFGAGGLGEDRGDASLVKAGEQAQEIPTRGLEPMRVMWAPDSKQIWFQSRQASSKRLIAVAVKGGGQRTLIERRGVPVRITASGGLGWRVGRVPEVVDLRGGNTRVFPIDIEVSRLREDVLRLGFRRIWRTLGMEFHDPRLNGRDWEAVRRKYEDAAAGARSSRQFDRVVSQLFGELNASHLSFLREPWPDERGGRKKPEKNGYPGFSFDDRDVGEGRPLRVGRVLPGSPVAGIGKPPVPGEVVVRIAGQAVDSGSPVRGFFSGAEGRILPMVLRDADGRERVIEVRCISYSRARLLERRAREARAAGRAAEAKPGAVYVAVRDMSRESYERLLLAVHRARVDGHERMVLDLRDNGGGREADRMLGLFIQPRHSFTVPRGGPRGYPLDRRPAPLWEGGLAVLCNSNTYSNSEIFCHAVQQLQRAPLVGTATAGGVISAVGTTIPDVGVLQVPFRSWFHAQSGENLDLNGARPGHLVPLGPADEDAGLDPQLDRALHLLGGAP